MSGKRLKYIARANIRETLAQAVRRHNLVILKAPAGYGKSTASRGLAKSPDISTAAISAENGPYAPEDVWKLICDTIREKNAPEITMVQEAGFQSSGKNWRAFLKACRKHMKYHPLLVILDDYQRVESTEMNALVEAIVNASIPGLCLLLISRDRPALPIEDLRVKNRAAIFGRAFLAFTRGETESFFALNGISDAEAAASTWTLSEGFPAVVTMCLASLLSHGTLVPAHDIQRFLTQSFFATYDEPQQRMLLELSAMPDFSAEEAAYICNDPSASHRLRAMFDTNVLLNYDHGTDSYRLLPLFREYLESLIEESALDVCARIGKAELFHRVGECFSRRGMRLEAARFMHKAGRGEDMERILAGFESPGAEVYLGRDADEMAAIVEDIPWDIRCKHPMGYLSFIFYYMLRVDRKYAATLLAEAEAYFCAQDCVSAAERRKILGEIRLVAAVRDFNDIQAMYDGFTRASELLQGRSGLLHENLSWSMDSPHLSFLYLRHPEMYKQLVQLVTRRWQSFQTISGVSAGSPELVFCEYLLERGEYLRARTPLAKAAASANATRELVMQVAVAFTRARLHLAHGQAESAWQALEGVAPEVAESGHFARMFMFDLSRGYIASILGQKERIPGWLLSDKRPELIEYCGRDAFAYVVRGKALIATRDWNRLTALVERAEHPLEALNIALGHIHLLLLKAVASMYTGNMSTALGFFSKAIDVGRPGNIIASIAEYGPHLHALQRYMHGRNPNDKYLAILGKNIKKYAKMNTAENQSLTLRERNIMQRVVRGENNREIGESLGISPGTVANTMGKIYAKLGAKNRFEAIRIWNDID